MKRMKIWPSVTRYLKRPVGEVSQRLYPARHPSLHPHTRLPPGQPEQLISWRSREPSYSEPRPTGSILIWLVELLFFKNVEFVTNI